MDFFYLMLFAVVYLRELRALVRTVLGRLTCEAKLA